jgi:surfeit locus 1 family protein
VQRLAWKEAVLARIDARIFAAPVAIPESPTEAADEYLPCASPSELQQAEALHRLGRGLGARIPRHCPLGHRAGRRMLVDRGYIPARGEGHLRARRAPSIIGNLLWPDEVDGYTPEPDATRGIWFARDVPAMAAALDTEPVLVVVSRTSSPRRPPQLSGRHRVDPERSPGVCRHLVRLAAVWAGMTLLLLWRIRRRST